MYLTASQICQGVFDCQSDLARLIWHGGREHEGGDTWRGADMGRGRLNINWEKAVCFSQRFLRKQILMIIEHEAIAIEDLIKVIR